MSPGWQHMISHKDIYPKKAQQLCPLDCGYAVSLREEVLKPELMMLQVREGGKKRVTAGFFLKMISPLLKVCPGWS